MKKLKTILTLLIFITTATILSACGGGVLGTLNFKYPEISMAINQELDLANLVELDGVKIEDVQFESSDPNVVYVRANGKLVSRNEGVSLITAKGYADAILEVCVEGTSIKFASPTNLSYDETQNAVVWDAVYAGNIVASTYNVTIVKNGAEPIYETTNKNSYEILEAGTYEIKVSCGARQDVGILASEESVEYQFSKLSAPTELQYNDETGILTWSADNESSAFRVLVNGVASEIIETRQYSLNLKEEKKYTILVMACANQSQHNVFGATSTQKLELTRLSAPSLAIDNGIITWTDAEQGASSFYLTVVGATTIKETISKNSAGKYSYNLQGIDSGEYYIEIFAKGDSADNIYDVNERFLTSEKSLLEDVKKLPKQAIQFNKENKTIEVVDYDVSKGYKLELNIRKDGALLSTHDISSTGKFQYSFAQAGTYEFVLSNLASDAMGKNNLEINADNSDKLTVVQLGTANNATHKIQNGEYFVENYSIAGATNYVVEILQKSGGSNRFELTDANNKVADLFAVAGEYVVNIIARGTDDDKNYIYYLDSVSNTTLSTIRLADCVLENDKDNKRIVWEDVSTLGSLRYNYVLTGASEDSGILESNEFSYAGLGVGSYTLSIGATSATGSGVQTIILDSMSKDTINFSITKTLTTPVLGWNKVIDETQTKYFLTISNVEGATSYHITLNGQIVKALDATTEEQVSYDVTTFFDLPGDGGRGETYIFNVGATSSNEFYNDSEIVSLTAKKAAAPQTFDYSIISNNSEVEVLEQIVSETSDPWYIGTDAWINGVQTNNLNNQSIAGTNKYQIKIKYLASDKNVGSGDNNLYYIDSDFAEFVLVKLSNSISISGNKISWTNDETTQSITNRLIISQGSSLQIVDVTQMDSFDIGDIDKSKFRFDSPISISIQTVAKSFTKDISGSYENGKFVSGTNVGGQYNLDSYFVTSDVSTINVQNVSEAQSVAIEEKDGFVTILWTKAEGVSSWKVNNKNTNKFSSESFESAVKNYFNLEEIIETTTGETRNVYLFKITRINRVNTIKVSKTDDPTTTETISSVNQPKTSSGLVCKIDGEQVTNLRSVSSTLITLLDAYYKAGENDGENYYLDSFTTQFKFQRLKRVNVASDFNISNDVISWNTEETDTNNQYYYGVSLYDSNGITYDFDLEVDEDSTGINFKQTKYADMLYSLTGDKFIKIQKVAEEFNANSNLTNYLTSEESIKQLYVLSAPTNVVISANQDDNSQTDITISWTTPNDGEISPVNYLIKIYNAYTSLEIVTQTYYTLSAVERQTFFATAGDWFTEVKSVGGKDTINAKDTISSKYSEPAKVVRLEKPQSLSISNGGLIEWGSVKNAGGYILEYSYTDANGQLQKKEHSFASNILNYQLSNEELAIKFNGTINAKLYALGVGTSDVEDGEIGYLSSTISQTFSRVVAPEFNLTSTKMVFTTYEQYTNGESVYVNASIDGKRVLNIQVSPTKDENGEYVWAYPKTYSYLENGRVVNVDFSTAKTITFDVCATINRANFLTSNTVTKSASILANVANLRFARTNDGVIHFYAENPNAGTQTKLTIGTMSFEQTGNMDLALSEELLGQIGTSWTFAVKALGSVNGDLVKIESGITSISGTKLSNVQTISTISDGAFGNTVINWSTVSGASDYRLKYSNIVDNVEYIKEGYQTTTQQKMGSDFIAGTYNVAIKPIGNVGLQEITASIILDGTYCNAVQITKLQAISNVAVQRGFISFDGVDDADAYIAVIYSGLTETIGTEYVLSQYTLPTGETGNFYYSQQLMDAISGGQSYILRLYAKSQTNLYISSEFAKIGGTGETDTYLEVSTFLPEDNQITLSHPRIDENNINYAKTFATLSTNSAINGGILLEVDGKIAYTTDKQYLLDENGEWNAGAHTLKYAQLGSDSIGADKRVYLTSFGATTTVTKLGTTTISAGIKDMSTGEQKITFSNVNGATSYFMYLSGVYTATYMATKADIEIDISKINVGTYDNLAICAISTDINYLAGNKIFLIDTESDTQAKIRKLNAPAQLAVKNGAYSFMPSSSELLGMYTSGSTQTPFYTNQELVKMQFLKFKFTNLTTGAVYELVDRAYKYFYITDELVSTLEGFGMADIAQQLKSAQQKGFPYLNYNFMDFAGVLTAGVYEIQVKLIGNTIEREGEEGAYTSATILLSSEYNVAIKKYISGAPQIRVENNNDVYNLKFTNVVVNSNYFDNNQNKKTYVLVGKYYETVEEKQIEIREELATVTANVADANDVIFNLTQLINDEVLTSKYTELFVYIKGNDETGALNGLCSNTIKIIVLEKITAFINHGEICWNAQNNASKYVVSYGEDKEVDIPYVDGQAIYSWDAKELNEGSKYKVTIMAYGTIGSTEETGGVLVLSGKITEIGTIQKLPSISTTINGIAVNNGVYNWNVVDNATAYDVYTTTNQITNGIYGEYTTINTNWYETQVEDNSIYYYYFRAVGDTYESLPKDVNADGAVNDDDIIYVNSSVSEYNKGQRTSAITELQLKNGIISWKIPERVTGLGYKLTFNRGGEDIVINILHEKCVTAGGYVYFDTNNPLYQDLHIHGNYTVKVQTYYKDKTETNTNTAIYYLISSPIKETFHKFEAISESNIKVENGTIKWTYSGGGSAIYHFRLHFTYTDTETNQQYEEIRYVASGINEYEGVIFNTDMSEYPITLKIFVVPGALDASGRPQDTNAKYALSVPFTYGPKIHQFNKVDENSIAIYLENNGQLKIDWADPNVENGENTYKYEICYYIDDSEDVRYYYTTQSEIICNDDSIAFDIDGEYSLKVKIRVIPVVENYISSAWTTERVIERPTGIENLSYNQETYTYTWDRYNTGDETASSFYYKIKDEVGEIKVIDGQPTFVVSAVYIFNANINDEVFTPFVVGYHRVSVAVIIKSSGNTGLMSEYTFASNCQYADESGTETVTYFDLFERGDGTELNPFVINSAEQFANIKYRLTKDATNNEFYNCTKAEDGTWVVPENITNAGANNTVYHFKQATHLELNPNQTLANYPDSNGISAGVNYEFNGNYNGNGYSLKLVWTSRIVGNSAPSTLTIFEKVGKNGTISNVNVINGIDTSISISKMLTISLLAYNNYGTITAVAIGKNDTNNTIRFDKNMSSTLVFSLLTYNNYGKIEYVENFYNVYIESPIDNTSAMSFASVAINGQVSSTISKAKNYGDITIRAYQVNIGGIVQTMDSASTITQSANLGDINVFVRSTYRSIIGGLVGQLSAGAVLGYCYSICDISLASASEIAVSANIGGLVGLSYSDNISYSYVNVTKNQNILSGYTAYEAIYQLIGYLGSIDQGNSKARYVYYNLNQQQNGFNCANIQLSEFRGYTTSSDICNVTEEFRSDLTYNSNPRLAWEVNYNPTWKA